MAKESVWWKQAAPVVVKARPVVPGHGTVGRDPTARLDADRQDIDDMIHRGESDDPRVSLPGMDEAHTHMRQLAKELRQSV
ncbi:MAG: hypothetical protein QM607_12920 [Microbacterium sp.]